MTTKIYCLAAITLCIMIGVRNIVAQSDAAGTGKGAV